MISESVIVTLKMAGIVVHRYSLKLDTGTQFIIQWPISLESVILKYFEMEKLKYLKILSF